MITYLLNNIRLFLRENEIDKTKIFINMLCLYIEESYKKKLIIIYLF